MIGVKKETATLDFFVETKEMKGEDEGFSAGQFSSFEDKLLIGCYDFHQSFRSTDGAVYHRCFHDRSHHHCCCHGDHHVPPFRHVFSLIVSPGNSKIT